jgi:hypothetical protein
MVAAKACSKPSTGFCGVTHSAGAAMIRRKIMELFAAPGTLRFKIKDSAIMYF